MSEITNKNRVEILSIFFFWIFQIIFCHSYNFLEVPCETMFDQMPLLESFYTNTLTFGDLLTRYGEHGMLGANLLFIFNAEWFGLTRKFDLFLYLAVMLVTGIIYIYNEKASFSSGRNRYAYLSCVVLTSALVFNVLNGTAGGMNTQVRLGFMFGIIAMHMCNRVFTAEVSTRYTCATVFLIILSVNVFGTLYSFAVFPVIFIITFFKVVRKKIRKVEWMLLFAYVVSFLLYFFQYGLLEVNSSASLELSGDVAQSAFVISLLTGILAYCGNMVLGYPAIADGLISDGMYMLIGGVILCIILYAVYRYITVKMYEITFFPIFLMGYSFSVLVMVSLGRHSGMWMSNNWYHLHTVPALVAAVWIILWDTKHSVISKKLAPFFMTCIVVLGIFGTGIAIRRAPHAYAWTLNKQQYLFAESIEDLPVDSSGNTPLLHSPSVTMKAIETMKKYNLSIYRYWDSYEKMTGSSEKPLAVSGVYGDGWLGAQATYKIKTTRHDLIEVSGYYNKAITGNEIIEIKIDDETILNYTIPSNSFTIEIPVDPNTTSSLSILAPFAQKGDGSDKRVLSFIVSDVSYSNRPKIVDAAEMPKSVNGVYEDGWLGEVATYAIDTGNHDLILLIGYYNKAVTGNEVIEIKIDNETVLNYVIPSNSFKIEIPVEKNCVSELIIASPFAKTADAPDKRVLSFIVSDIAYSNCSR